MAVPQRLSWTPPRPLATPGAEAPSVLRFATDDFMAELESDVAAAPSRLTARLARAEHWSESRSEPFEVPARPDPPTPTASSPIKLYQPVHGRFYLVAAQLVCRRYGLPDHRPGDTEHTGFVVRRVVHAPVGGTGEYAWIGSSDAGRWMAVADPHALVPGEEVLGLAPTTYDHGGRRSRLLTGLIPVSRRERYEARDQVVRPEGGPDSADPLANPRRALFDSTVIGAFRQLHDFKGLPSGGVARPEVDAREEMLRLALVDLVDFVQKVAKQDLNTLTDLLANADALGAEVHWAEVVALTAVHRDAVLAGKPVPEPLGGWLRQVDSLSFTTLIAKLKGYRGTVAPPTAPAVAPGSPPEPGMAEGASYVVRCVYRRSDCPHQRPEWISAPAGPFRFASFFDPDAPARPIQIALPVDTSPSGLRQFPRNVSVVVSQQLRRQMSQVKGMNSIGAPEGGLSLGMVCSLSIPIITICALVLLMIIVTVLNVVFRWLPFFRICLPKPGAST